MSLSGIQAADPGGVETGGLRQTVGTLIPGQGSTVAEGKKRLAGEDDIQMMLTQILVSETSF